MRTTIILLASISLLLSGCKSGQTGTGKQAKKTAEEIEEKMQYEAAMQALNNREFVLEADRIIFKYGESAYVNATTNFISMHKDRATIQLAFSSMHAGPNGIGGITVEGIASNIKLNRDKKGNISYSMTVQGTGVSAMVSINIPYGTNKCTSVVSPNFNSNRITFSGYLYPESESNIYKGRSL